MKSFNQWKKDISEQVDPPITNPSAAAEEPVTPEGPQKPKITTKELLQKFKVKPWKASKKQILDFWRSLQPGMPLNIKPIDYEHEGSTIQEDGIRITGSKEFISSALARLKDFLNYENPNTKLMVAYRQSPRSFIPGNKNSYIFYLQTMERGKD
jgi:hypothetical protein